MGLPSCFTGKTKVSLEVADLDALSFKLLADALHKGQCLGSVPMDAQGIALDLDLLTSDCGDLVSIKAGQMNEERTGFR